MLILGFDFEVPYDDLGWNGQEYDSSKGLKQIYLRSCKKK